MKLLLSLFAFCAVASLSAQKTMTLRDCIERAQQRNIKVQQADLARRQQEIQLDDARKAMLPEVGGSAGENLSFGRGLTANNTYETRNTNSTSLSISGSMPLYTGGRIAHRRKPPSNCKPPGPMRNASPRNSNYRWRKPIIKCSFAWTSSRKHRPTFAIRWPKRSEWQHRSAPAACRRWIWLKPGRARHKIAWHWCRRKTTK